jgi:hypothetical protein
MLREIEKTNPPPVRIAAGALVQVAAIGYVLRKNFHKAKAAN